MGVASNSVTTYVRKALMQIELLPLFEFVAGVDQVAEGKPAPDVYLYVARKLGCAPEVRLAVEDLPSGVQAATAAGMTCVLVPNPDLALVDDCGAHFVFPSLVDLDQNLERRPLSSPWPTGVPVMTKAWTSRRRVLTALAHQEPDRLPMDFMGTASCMVDTAYFALVKRLGLQGTGREFRKNENTRFYDERVLEGRSASTSGGCGCAPAATGRRRPTSTGASPTSGGCAGGRPATCSATSARPWKAPRSGISKVIPGRIRYASGRLEGLAEEARRLHEQGEEHAIVARSPTLGMFELAQRLRGMQRFLMDLVLDKEFAIHLVQTLKEVHMGLYDVYLDAVGPYVDIVETSDDFGAQTRP